MKHSRLIGPGLLFVAISVALVAAATNVGSVTSSLPIEAITAHETVSASARDSIDPLLPNTPSTVTADAAIAKLQGYPGIAPYMSTPAKLRIRLGLYNGPNLSVPAINIPAYVISGGQAACAVSGPSVPVGRTSSLKREGSCTATVVVDARTGLPLVFYRIGPS